MTEINYNYKNFDNEIKKKLKTVKDPYQFIRKEHYRLNKEIREFWENFLFDEEFLLWYNNEWIIKDFNLYGAKITMVSKEYFNVTIDDNTDFYIIIEFPSNIPDRYNWSIIRAHWIYIDLIGKDIGYNCDRKFGYSTEFTEEINDLKEKVKLIEWFNRFEDKIIRSFKDKIMQIAEENNTPANKNYLFNKEFDLKNKDIEKNIELKWKKILTKDKRITIHNQKIKDRMSIDNVNICKYHQKYVENNFADALLIKFKDDNLKLIHAINLIHHNDFENFNIEYVVLNNSFSSTLKFFDIGIKPISKLNKLEKIELLKEKRTFLNWTKEFGEEAFTKYCKEIRKKMDKEMSTIEKLTELVKNI